MFVFSVQSLSLNDNISFFYLLLVFSAIEDIKMFISIQKPMRAIVTHYIYLMASSNSLFWIKDFAVIILPLIPPVFSNSTVSRYRLSLNKFDKYYKRSFRYKYIKCLFWVRFKWLFLSTFAKFRASFDLYFIDVLISIGSI